MSNVDSELKAIHLDNRACNICRHYWFCPFVLLVAKIFGRNRYD